MNRYDGVRSELVPAKESMPRLYREPGKHSDVIHQQNLLDVDFCILDNVYFCFFALTEQDALL